MQTRKSKYLFSPKLSFLEPTAPVISIEADVQSKDLIKDVYEDVSDLLSHSDMSWESLEDRYVPHEIPSDDFMSVHSDGSSDSSSSSLICAEPLFYEDDDQRRCVMEGNWGGYALDADLWEDDRAPVVKIRRLQDVYFDDYEYCGFFTDRLIGIGSSFLDKSPENGLYVLNKCVMRDMSLINITMLYFHRYLQYIDLTYNFIMNLSPLGGIPYLMYLNVSHNRLRQTLDFSPPWYLTYVDLSFNYIPKMLDFSGYWSIVRLDLSHNAIEEISGLENLKYLQYLDLSYNLIECIENLDKLNIRELNLEGNCITSFRSSIPGYSMNTLPNLRMIHLAYNRLSSLGFFKDVHSLRFVDLRFNKINDLLEVSNLKGSIHEIDLRGNSCVKWPNYRDVLLFSIPNVVVIDGIEVTTAQKVSATTLFASPLDLVAARAVTKLTLLEQLCVPRIDSYVKPYDEVYPPLIILSGPSAVKKIALALHVSETLSKRVRYCMWYTTKKVEDTENERKTYICVSREEFSDMTRHGDFLAVQELLGHSYGFHQDQIVCLMREKKVGIIQMDLNATIQMSRRYPNIKPVLVLTKSEEVHRNWISDKFDVYTWVKDSVQNLLAVKIGRCQEDTKLESKSSVFNFVGDILHDVIDRLPLPTYSIFVRPQGTGATTTDIIAQSRTMLPKVVIPRSEVEMDQKKRITFMEYPDSDSHTDIENFLHEQKEKMKDLKVILDEQSNIIIEDKESKRRTKHARILYRRSTLETDEPIHTIDEFDDSISSEDTIFDLHPRALRDTRKIGDLKDMYTDLVMRTRKNYLQYHRNKPGFFCLVLLTDNYPKAFNKLIDFIHNVFVEHSVQKPISSKEMEHFANVAIPAAAKNIVDELRESSSTCTLQRRKMFRTHGLTSWKDLMPSQMIRKVDH